MVNFLDIKIYRDQQGNIATTLYRKETATNSLLHARSQHPQRTITGIPVGQYLRIKRICSNPEDFKSEAKKLYERFRERGYSHNSLKKAYKRALDTDRQSLLISKNTNSKVNSRNDNDNTKLFRLIGDFSAEHNKIKHIVNKHWHILQQDSQLKEVIGETPLITFRRSKNLRDTLTRSHYTQATKTTWLTSKMKGCHKCGDCLACPLVTKTLHVTQPRDNVEYTIKNYINCKTLREFRRRVLEHVGDVKHKRNTSVAVHINECHNGNTKVMQFFAVEQLKQTSRIGDVNKKLLQAEARWIYAMNSKSPNGLNEGFTFSPFL
ncbi:hypothetical protein XELAEV_18027381mg [Xenopus laevis]|uniref:Helix-turn-helix domain-containing protein n=1 Tax=Xenopus laevis TaxID=8355 RepID=A0A974HJQ7_XENLA|nr:hypothetical protein XELAEV_18027381mg [Xenopus laevis]